MICLHYKHSIFSQMVLSIRFQVSPAGLIWESIYPFTVAEFKVFLEDNDSISPEELYKQQLIKANGHLKHQFTKIGNEYIIPGPDSHFFSDYPVEHILLLPFNSFQKEC